jgi:hypothetical protein
VVRFKIRGKDRERLLIGRRVVGQYSEERGEWHIRRPWRFFVDCNRLS